MIKVLFVCLGNICRSPMADAIFQKMVNDAGLADEIRVDSAGTGGWHVGETAHTGTLKVLGKHQVPYNGRARQLTLADFSEFDYLLAMDKSNLSNMMRLGQHGDGQPEIAMFLSYANQAGTVREVEVPDPYYDGRFDEVYDLVSRGCAALLDDIRTKHRL